LDNRKPLHDVRHASIERVRMSQEREISAAARPLIAIVEDDESLRPALDGLVRSLGYSSETFASAEAFLASGASARADCLVCDYQLPGLNGIGLAGKLQGLLPTIIMTARAERVLDALARENGVTRLLRKPFEAEELASCIRSALDTRHCCADKGQRDRTD
jgi:FixJ family two-component response regulator